LNDAGLVQSIEAVDVQPRPITVHPVSIYDGNRLPYGDNEFPLVYAVDVLHHCQDPLVALKECLRVCSGCFMLKDHCYRTRVGWWTLALLDELGNRCLSVPSRYKYQRGFEWFPVIESEGFRLLLLSIHCIATADCSHR